MSNRVPAVSPLDRVNNFDSPSISRGTSTAIALGFVASLCSAMLIGPDVAKVLAWDDSSVHSFFASEAARKASIQNQTNPFAVLFGKPKSAPRSFETVELPAKRVIARAASVSRARKSQAASVSQTANSQGNTASINQDAVARYQEVPDGVSSSRLTPGTSTSLAPSLSHHIRKKDGVTLGKTTAPQNNNLNTRAVCVRLCDGFFFPAGDYRSGVSAAGQESTCQSLCPGAPTRLYVIPRGSAEISDAIAYRSRQNYTALPVAFRYAATTDKTCACVPNNVPQSQLLSHLRDLTMRQGDTVMTDRGFRTFRGAAKFPYRNGDFSKVSQSDLLTENERKALLIMERTSKEVPVQYSLAPNGTDAPLNPSEVVKRDLSKQVRVIGSTSSIFR